MFRRILVMAIVCGVFGACLALASKAEKEGYTIMPAADTMGTAEVQAALDTLGLHVARFVDDIPYRHAIRFRVEEYRHGRLAGMALVGRLDAAAGMNRILVFARQDADRLRFSVSYAEGDHGHGGVAARDGVSTRGVRSSAWDEIEGARLVPGRRLELLRYSADTRDTGPRGFLPKPKLKDAITRHDLVVAVFATLERAGVGG